MTDIAMFTSGFSFKTIDIIPHMSISTVECGSSVTMLASAYIQYALHDLFVFCWTPDIIRGIIPVFTANVTAFDPQTWESMNEVVLTSSWAFGAEIQCSKI